jgi:hypothetical protein
MCVYVCILVVLCLGSGFAAGSSRIQEVLQIVYRSGQGHTKGRRDNNNNYIKMILSQLI